MFENCDFFWLLHPGVCIVYLTWKLSKKYLKHSTSYYNYFMFNLCITLFFTETSCFRCIFFSCCRFCVSRYFFSIPNLSIFVKWLPWKERDNHKNEATIYIMIIFNDNATFLLFFNDIIKNTCTNLFKNSHFCRAFGRDSFSTK